MAEKKKEEPKASADNNWKVKGAGCDVWGDQRMALAKVLRDDILPKTAVADRWFIEHGTLLGAWRSGKWIPHDDDFDIAILFDGTLEDARAGLEALLPVLKEALPEQYDARLLEGTKDYADKIEVFEPSAGRYTLAGPQYKGADYFYVIVDLQAYSKGWKAEQGDGAGRYKACYHVSDVYQYDEKDVFPLGSIQLEGEVFPAPAKVEPALEGCYGSLKKGAKYNPATKKYEDPPAEGAPEPKKSKTTDA